MGNWTTRPPDTKGKIVVVDFWATWCGPCTAAIPKNNALVAHYGSRGLVLLGIHDANRGTGKVPQIIAQRKITYPVAVDQGGASARAWKVSFWPTYAVLDRDGIARAIGLDSGSVEKVVERLLAEAGAQDQRERLEGSAVNRRRLKELAAGETPPPLRATDWTNTTPLKLEELKGNVVLLNFWTPSRRACTPPGHRAP